MSQKIITFQNNLSILTLARDTKIIPFKLIQSITEEQRPVVEKIIY